MSFAGTPAAAAGARGDGNVGEADQVAGVSDVQAQHQAAIESGDQAHPQAAVGSGDQAHPQATIRSGDQSSLNRHRSLRVNKLLELLMNVSFSSKITTSRVVMELIFCFVALGCRIQFNKVGHTIRLVGLDSLAFMSNDWRAHTSYCIHKT